MRAGGRGFNAYATNAATAAATAAAAAAAAEQNASHWRRWMGVCAGTRRAGRDGRLVRGGAPAGAIGCAGPLSAGCQPYP